VLYITAWHVECARSTCSQGRCRRKEESFRAKPGAWCRQEYFSHIPGKDPLKVLKTSPGKSRVSRVPDVKSRSFTPKSRRLMIGGGGPVADRAWILKFTFSEHDFNVLSGYGYRWIYHMPLTISNSDAPHASWTTAQPNGKRRGRSMPCLFHYWEVGDVRAERAQTSPYSIYVLLSRFFGKKSLLFPIDLPQ